jgi:hypothetical protein
LRVVYMHAQRHLARAEERHHREERAAACHGSPRKSSEPIHASDSSPLS